MSRLIKVACARVALAAVGAGAWITWQRHQQRVVSDVVTRRAAAQALAEHTGVLAESSKAVLSTLDRQEDRWRGVEDALRDLHLLAENENRALLELVGHHVSGLELETAKGETPGAEGEGDAVAAGQGGEGDGGGAADPQLLAEVQRMSGLLSSIYREMALVIRTAANKLDGSQGEMTRLIRRLIKRSDAQSASSTHQILLLRNLLQYMGKDEAKLRQILDQVALEKPQEEVEEDEPQ